MYASIKSPLPAIDSLPADIPRRRHLSYAGKTESLDRNHLFADNIRFWSMVSIVAVHCLGACFSEKWTSPQLYLLFDMTAKFGTIGFFLIAGFLMGERLDRCKPLDYFMRRINKVALPWLFWLFMISALPVRTLLIRRGVSHVSFPGMLRALGTALWANLWHSAFWFVPNFLLGIAVLLVFRRYLYTLWFGLCLLAINLVYVVNIYALWFHSLHTEALFGFVFYLWLGSQIAYNFHKFKILLDRISLPAALVLAFVTCVMSYGESLLLNHLGNPDSGNTLRISNQLFSLSVALVIFKLTRPTWPRFLDVRRHTFGLYLSHSIVIIAVMRYVRPLHLALETLHIPFYLDYVLSAAVLFVITYLISFAITECIARRPSLRWMVGLSSQEPAPQAVANPFGLVAQVGNLIKP